MRINLEKFTGRAIKFIRETVAGAGFKKVIVAVSGGVDSLTTLVLCSKALEGENVLAVMLPCGELGRDGVKRAIKVCTEFKIPQKNQIITDIHSMATPFLEAGMSKLRQGNIIARVRMIALYDLAKKQRALVCGTENKSEYLLGYFTRFGDEASDLEPIRSLYKTQVYEVAKFLGLPSEVLAAQPSAGLWQDQTDEGELGFSYEEADPILQLMFDKKMGTAEIVKRGYERELVEKVEAWVKRNKFKHRVPYVFSF